MEKTGYENMTDVQLVKLLLAHIDVNELVDMDKNDCLILGMQLIEWSRR